MGTNTFLDEIATYFVLDFLQTKASLTIKGEESRKLQRVRHLGNFGQAQFIEPVSMIGLSSVSFYFSHQV